MLKMSTANLADKNVVEFLHFHTVLQGYAHTVPSKVFEEREIKTHTMRYILIINTYTLFQCFKLCRFFVIFFCYPFNTYIHNVKSVFIIFFIFFSFTQQICESVVYNIQCFELKYFITGLLTFSCFQITLSINVCVCVCASVCRCLCVCIIRYPH